MGIELNLSAARKNILAMKLTALLALASVDALSCNELRQGHSSYGALFSEQIVVRETTSDQITRSASQRYFL
jgi:hypothetical protein